MKKLVLLCSFGLLGSFAMASNELDEFENSDTQSCEEMMYEVFDMVEASSSYSSHQLINIQTWLLSFC